MVDRLIGLVHFERRWRATRSPRREELDAGSTEGIRRRSRDDG
jgi:hypothetical protein